MWMVKAVVPLLFGFTAGRAWSPNYNLPLDRSFTLRNAEPFLLERERDRLLSSEAPLSWVFPRPCISSLDSSQECEEGAHLTYRDDSRQEAISLQGDLAGEYRERNPGYPQSTEPGTETESYEGGIIGTGGKGPVSFFLDVRSFTQNFDNGGSIYYDREPVDVQKKSSTGSFSFVSYSRYRANMALDLPFARMVVARDAAQWGPGLFTNLAFQQDAVPFNQYDLQTHLGPISVTSLYGDLLGIGNNQDEKNLYAHRYEWRAGKNWLLGATDELILYRENKAYLFFPVIPLFIAKGYLKENDNNGLLSADITYRIPGYGLIYSEFLLDDMESPSSLILKNYRENKWGFMAGTQWGGSLWGKRCGFVTEFSHVEPWVYTHFPDHPAQASNGDYPLGNPFGPNSQAVIFKTFIRPRDDLYLSTKLLLLWKGRDSGSSITDAYSEGDNLLSKTFLNGVDYPEATLSPFISYSWRCLHGELEADIRRRPAFYLRLQSFY